VIPSGYKTSKVYSVKPTDGTGDLTFTRSNDTATRVGPDGLIEKVRTNLLLQSNSFDTTWTNFNTTDTGGQSGYDGTNDAWLLQNTATSGSIRQTISASGVQTYSFYAKAGTTDWVAAYVAGSIIPYCFFDLTNGVKGATQNNVINSNITAVGGGWYRIAIAFDNTTTDVRIFPAEANAVLASQVGDNIYIQSAQLEAGDIATEPILTTTAAVSVGPVANVPRLDYLNSSCPRLLLEPTATALNQYSEQINNAWWSKTRATISANATATLDPSGYNGSDLMVQDAADTNGGAFFKILTFAAGAHTFSVFAKMDEVRYINLAETASSASTRRTWFDLQSGVVGTTSAGHTAKIDNYGNGWYRCSITFTANAGTFGILAYLSDADNSTTAAVSKGSYFWGANLMATSYLQSYIPTLGAAVTRGTDDAFKTGIASLIGQTEGTVMVEYDQSVIGQSATRRIFALSDGTTSNRITAYISSSNGIEFYVRNSGGDLFLGAAASPIGNTKGVHKIAAAYKNGDYAVYLDGVQIISGAGTAGTIPACSRFDLGQQLLASDLHEPIMQALLFTTRLTNAQLAELTTI
jgi:hypothetical protein